MLKPYVYFLFLVGYSVYAANSYRVNNGASQYVSEHLICRNVTNATGRDIFIPTKSSGEWGIFRNKAPGGISFTNCPGTIAISMSSTGYTGDIIAASLFLTGTDDGGPDASSTAFNLGESFMTTTVTTTQANSWLVDIITSGNTGAFTASAGQTERVDRSFGSSNGAMSTKTIAVAAASSTTWSHNSVDNRKAILLAAFGPNGAIAFGSSSSGAATNAATLSFAHGIADLNAGKLILGVSIEDNTCVGSQIVSSAVHNNKSMTYIGGINTATGALCARVEMWYLDFSP